MGKLFFLTGTMSSGKTTHLLQSHFNLDYAFPNQVLLINKNDRSGDSVCSNRLGGAALATSVDNASDIIKLVAHHEEVNYTTIKYIFVDEVQFFTNKQIEQLAHLADIHDCEVYAYGLLTTYKGELFDASKRLLELCDRIIQLNNAMRCWCGKRATHNALFMYGRAATSGKTEVVDNSEVIDYQVMCRRHFLEHIEHQNFAVKVRTPS